MTAFSFNKFLGAINLRESSPIVNNQEKTSPVSEPIDHLAMPSLARESVSRLDPYMQKSIGSLVARQFMMEATLLEMRTRMEVAAASIIGLAACLSFASVAEFASGLGTSTFELVGAVGCGALMLVSRRGVEQIYKHIAQRMETRNFSLNPEYLSFQEAQAGVRNNPRGSLDQLIAMRHVLADVPLLPRSEAPGVIAKLLSEAELSLRGDLIRVDATTAFLEYGIHPIVSKSDFDIFARNLLELIQGPQDLFDRIWQNVVCPDVEERRQDLINLVSEAPYRLFRADFEDPVVKCDSLILARRVISILNKKEPDQILKALDENCIEVLLSAVSEITDPHTRLEFIKCLKKMGGFESDQKLLVRQLRKVAEEQCRLSAELELGNYNIPVTLLSDKTLEKRSRAA